MIRICLTASVVCLLAASGALAQEVSGPPAVAPVVLHGAGSVPPLTITGVGPASSVPSVGLYAVPWNSTGVLAIRPNVASAGGILDILANGANQDSWIDMGDEYTASNPPWQGVELRYVHGSYGSLTVKGLNGKADLPLAFNANLGSNMPIGFNTFDFSHGEQYHFKLDQNGETALVNENASTGGGAYAAFEARNAANASNFLRMEALSSSFTANGAYTANGGVVELGPNNSGTLSLMTRNASSPIKFYTGDFAAANLRLALGATGGVLTPSFLQVGSAAAATASAGEVVLAKETASGTAPGAGFLKFEAVAGTNAGSCKIIAYAGTSTTPVTVIDNVGSGC